MEHNPTKIRIRLKSNSLIQAVPGLLIFGILLYSIQHFYLKHVRDFKKMEIRGIVLGIEKSFGSKGAVSYYVSIKLENGQEYGINNGLERNLLPVVSPGDSILKKRGESVVTIPNKNLSLDLIDRGPW
jgi:hypothetical protein